MSKKTTGFTETEKDKLWRDDGIDYDWLIDQLEGETFRAKPPQNFVLSSHAELQAYESLHHIRQILKSCDDVNLPESGAYYQKESDKIMAKILSSSEKPEKKSTRRESSKILKRLVTHVSQKNQLAVLNLMLLAMSKFI